MNPPSENIDTLDLEGAADYLKVHPNTVLNLLHGGSIEGAKVGEKWVFFKADLAKYLRSAIHEQMAKIRAGTAVKSEVSQLPKKGRRYPALPTVEEIKGASN